MPDQNQGTQAADMTDQPRCIEERKRGWRSQQGAPKTMDLRSGRYIERAALTPTADCLIVIANVDDRLRGRVAVGIDGLQGLHRLFGACLIGLAQR